MTPKQQETQVVGQQLAKARRQAAMTAGELVRRLETVSDGKYVYTTGSIYSWEKGRNRLPDKLIPYISRVLGCSPQNLRVDGSVVPVEIEYVNGPRYVEPRPAEDFRALPTMDEVRKKGHEAFIGMGHVSMMDMDLVLSMAADPNWPPE